MPRYLQQHQPVLYAALFLLHPEEDGSKNHSAAHVAAQTRHSSSLVTSDLTPAATQEQLELPESRTREWRQSMKFEMLDSC